MFKKVNLVEMNLIDVQCVMDDLPMPRLTTDNGLRYVGPHVTVDLHTDGHVVVSGYRHSVNYITKVLGR